LESEVQIRTSSSEDSIEHRGINGDKDDLDACQAYAVKPENWSIQLARLLQGRALEVYQR